MPAAILGKDGRPFDPDRYVSWGLSGRSALRLRPLALQPRKTRVLRVPVWRCPNCQRRFTGRAVGLHRAVACVAFSMFRFRGN